MFMTTSRNLQNAGTSSGFVCKSEKMLYMAVLYLYLSILQSVGVEVVANTNVSDFLVI